MQPAYRTMEEMIGMIDEPNRSICQKVLADNRKLFQTAPGSTHNHQAWPGGYFDHVQEGMNIAIGFYNTLQAIRPPPFSLSDALLAFFLHDFEKPWRFEKSPDGTFRNAEAFATKSGRQAFREQKIAECGFCLTEEHRNAIKYAEGELNDYSSERRVMNELAAFCHLCDVTSARIWYNHPSDPWAGATRVRDT